MTLVTSIANRTSSAGSTRSCASRNRSIKPAGHLAVSAFAGAAAGIAFGGVAPAIAAVAGGVLVDCDHLIDHYFNFGSLDDYGTMYTRCARHELRHVYLIFHSYEILIAASAVIIFSDLGPVWSALVFGYAVHLLSDQLTNPVRPLAYFFLYRLALHFEARSIIDQKRKDLFV